MTSVSADRRIDGSTDRRIGELQRVFISAGEPSGDAHAANLVREIVRRHPGVTVDAIGGAAMRAAGANVWYDAGKLGAVGLVEAAHALPRHVVLLARIRERLAAARYDLVVVVDYPGLHLRVARAAAAAGSPVLYYIAPQVWAWAPWRVATLRRAVRQLAVILPFEERFFRERGVQTAFVGHPLLDRAAAPARAVARRRLGLETGAPVVAVFPGSRAAERARHTDLFNGAMEELRRAVPQLGVVIAQPDGGAPARGPSVAAVAPPDLALAAADAALIKSGTATLEAALAGVPMVVAYRMHPVTFSVARRLVRVPHVSLVNLVAGRALVPELLQRTASAPTLAEALLPLLHRDGAPSRAQRHGFAEVRARLGAPGVAERVADLAEATARAG